LKTKTRPLDNIEVEWGYKNEIIIVIIIIIIIIIPIL
jgi:hypothetical protein